MPNIYKVFKDLIPTPPLQVGKVIAVNAGQCIIQLPGGGYVTGRGVGSLNKMVFVRDGLIEGAAPDLTVVNIEI